MKDALDRVAYAIVIAVIIVAIVDKIFEEPKITVYRARNIKSRR